MAPNAKSNMFSSTDSNETTDSGSIYSWASSRSSARAPLRDMSIQERAKVARRIQESRDRDTERRNIYTKKPVEAVRSRVKKGELRRTATSKENTEDDYILETLCSERVDRVKNRNAYEEARDLAAEAEQLNLSFQSWREAE